MKTNSSVTRAPRSAKSWAIPRETRTRRKSRAVRFTIFDGQTRGVPRRPRPVTRRRRFRTRQRRWRWWNDICLTWRTPTIYCDADPISARFASGSACWRNHVPNQDASTISPSRTWRIRKSWLSLKPERREQWQAHLASLHVAQALALIEKQALLTKPFSAQ